MKQIDLYSTMRKMLIAKPHLRRTVGIKKVVWNIRYLEGALDEDGKMSFDAFNNARPESSIRRDLQDVKSNHDEHLSKEKKCWTDCGCNTKWRDKESEKRENEEHVKHGGNPAFTPNPSVGRPSEAQNEPPQNVYDEIGPMERKKETGPLSANYDIKRGIEIAKQVMESDEVKITQNLFK